MTKALADVVDIANAMNDCDHSDPKVQVLHDKLWKGVWRHRDALGLTREQLLNLPGQRMETFGGGTNKTEPPVE